MKKSGRAWAILDQGLSSASNFAFAIAAANSLSTPEFGFYAVLTAAYWLIIGSGRAVVGETLLVSFGKHHDDQAASLSAAAPANMLVGMAGSCLVGLSAAFFSARASELLTMALFLPVLAYQDGLRYQCFATQRYKFAFASDLAWLAVFAIAYASLRLGGASLSIVTLTTIWGLGAAVASLVPMVLGARPWRFRCASIWIFNNRTLALKSWGEFVVGSGTGQAVIFGIPLVASLAVAGEFKTAQISVAPWQVTVTAFSILAIPDISARVRSCGPVAGLWTCIRLSTAAGAAGGLYIAVVALLPDAWGEFVFGPAWIGASGSAVVLAGAATLIAMSQSVVYFARAIGTSGRLLLARIVLAPITLILALSGAMAFGAPGVAYGLAASAIITLLAWWLLAAVDIRRERIQSSGTTRHFSTVKLGGRANV
jgi:hypothetical protein